MRRIGSSSWRFAVATAFAFGLSLVSALAEAPARPYLWKIEGKGAKPSWIFGTIHSQRPDIVALPAMVLKAIDTSDAVYTEIPADMASMLGLAPMMMLPDGKTLRDVIGAQLTTELDKEFRKINPALSLEPFQQFKPWAVSAMAFELEDQMKYAGSQAMDTVIYQRGESMGKEVGGIETAEEQLTAMDSFTDAEQAVMVKDTIRQLRDLRARHTSIGDYLSNLYLTGDLDKLVTELMKLDAGSDPKLADKFLDRLLYKRNVLMAERIVAKLQAQPAKSYFFAVGAAHLQGERGLLVALEKAGFKLTRVQ